MTPRPYPKPLAFAACCLALLLPIISRAQTPEPDPKSAQDSKPSSSAPSPGGRSDRAFVNNYPADWSVKTYYLHNIAQQNDANEILVALRNTLLPSVKVFLVTSDYAIVLYASPEQHQLATALIHDLDRPRQSYKLTYTLTETDAGKRVGMQHYSLFIVTGQRSTLKQGSKVPLLAGTSPGSGSSAPLQNFQYIDVGMNFDATLDPYNNGLRLRTKVEQSSTSEDKTISLVAEPVIRQSVIEEVAILTPGKPANLGSMEIPGTTRRIDIDVVADPLP